VKRLLIASVVVVAISLNALGQQSDFHWLSSKSSLSRQVHRAFANELAPDRNDPQTHVLPMTFKFVHRVGLRGKSALVLIGEKENKTSPYAVYRAFSFDLRTQTKAAVRDKNIEWFWMWELDKVRNWKRTSVSSRDPRCATCEATKLLADFHYSESTGIWKIRQWSKEDGPELMIGDDIQSGDDGFYYTDCLHTVGKLTGKGLDDVAVRCRQRVQPDPEQPQKRVTRDETLLYIATGDGKLARVVVGETSKYFTTIQAALCTGRAKSPLCRKPDGRSKKIQ
jgi:hypothetical protein